MLKNVNKYAEAIFANQDPVTYDWAALADTWANRPDLEEHSVIHDAIHKIMWGFAPKKGYSTSYLQYIDAVAEVMETCDEAVEAWRARLDFVNERDYIAATMDPEVDGDKDYRFTIIHYHYLRDRMLCKLEFERKFCGELDENCAKFWRNYEAAIIHLIPSAASWSREQWGDENNIHDALRATYGVDYRENIFEFDRVMFLKMYSNSEDDIDDEISWYAMNITRLPYSLAEALWPGNTKEMVRKLFVNAVKYTLDYESKGKPNFKNKDEYIHATGIFDRADLLNSWIYKQCFVWNNDSVFAGAEGVELKNALFNIMIQ